MEKERISIEEFSKVEIKVGTVRSAERVPETDKLLRLTVDFGEEAGPRQIVSGIAAYVADPGTLVGRQLAFITNLAPRTGERRHAVRGRDRRVVRISHTRQGGPSRAPVHIN